MLGLRDVLEGRPKEEIPIQAEASGDPPHLDVDGLDEQLDDRRRMVGPPLERIEDLSSLTRSKRRRRSR